MLTTKKKWHEKQEAPLAEALQVRTQYDMLEKTRLELIAAQSDPKKEYNKKLKSHFGKTFAQYTAATEKGAGYKTEINAANLDSLTRRELFLINNATLTMQLDFDIKEKNDNSATGSITWPIHFGTISLGFDAGLDKNRQAIRIVKTTSLFGELADTAELDCSGQYSDPEDFHARPYPITGNVGIDEFVSQYFEIVRSTRLVTASEGDTFTDTLTFTTKVNGGLKPSLELKPMHPSLVTASMDLKAEREDVHKVSLQIKPYVPEPPVVATVTAKAGT